MLRLRTQANWGMSASDALELSTGQALPLDMAASKALLTFDRGSMERRRMRLYALCLILDLVAIIAGFWLGSQTQGARGLEINGFPVVFGAVPFFVAFGLMYGAYSVK